MFCKNCGAEISDNTAFCGMCGAQVSAAAPQQPVVPQPQQPVVPQPQQPVYQAPERPQVPVGNPQVQPVAGGSYGSGLIGALLGALIGAVVWAAVYSLGFVSGLVGLLVGFLAVKGYDILKGKQAKGKIAILIIAVIVGVVAGTFGGLCLDVMNSLNELGMSMDSFDWALEVCLEDSEIQGEIAANLGMGLVFAGLGVFGLIRNEWDKLKN